MSIIQPQKMARAAESREGGGVRCIMLPVQLSGGQCSRFGTDSCAIVCERQETGTSSSSAQSSSPISPPGRSQPRREKEDILTLYQVQRSRIVGRACEASTGVGAAQMKEPASLLGELASLAYRVDAIVLVCD